MSFKEKVIRFDEKSITEKPLIHDKCQYFHLLWQYYPYQKQRSIVIYVTITLPFTRKVERYTKY